MTEHPKSAADPSGRQRSENAQLLAALRRQGLPPDGSARIELIPGGFWNRVYRLRGAGCDWVVKQFALGVTNRMFPILPDHEARALASLGPLALAPGFVAFLPDVGGAPVLIYEYYPGEAWRENAAMVGEYLARLHRVTPEHGFRRRPTSARGILDNAEEILTDLQGAADDRAALEALRPPSGEDSDGPAVALVHTDCGPDNLIVGPRGVLLIDWQCPGIGDPVEDIACFVSPAIQILNAHPPLSEAQRADFFAAYGSASCMHRYMHLGSFYHFRTAAYCLLRRESLRRSDRDRAHRYARAFDAECRLLERLHAAG